MVNSTHLDPIDRYALNLMTGALWLIPSQQQKHLISICLDLEERGLCSVGRMVSYRDGRILCELTDTGRRALASTKGS
jgi:hypothetical protein